MSRIFLSHSSRDNAEAIALRQWLIGQRPGLADEVFLDVEPDAGIGGGVRWKDALRQANSRCEAVICLVSKHWQGSHECKAEYRTAEMLGKQILVARLEPVETDITGEWQRCDLFGDGPAIAIESDPGGPVRFRAAGLQRLLAGLGPVGIGAENFAWPPPYDTGRAPYRGWEPFEAVDAGVFFGRDTQILDGRDRLVAMRAAGVQSVFAVLGPSGAGKSSYLRAGLLPRLACDDRHFCVLDIVRPAREALTGSTGLATVIHATRSRFGLEEVSRGDIAALCDQPHRVRGWLREIQQAATTRLLDNAAEVRPTLILPIDQAEELFAPDAGQQGRRLLRLLAELVVTPAGDEASRLGLIVVVCMRTDRYEAWQTAPQLAGVKSVVFDGLGPMQRAMFKDVIVGPATRLTQAGRRLEVRSDLVDRLLADCTEGADTLPLLALMLSRLYHDYGGSGALTVEQYAAIGGIPWVVRREIDNILAWDPIQQHHQLALLRAAFIPWLATVNPDNDQPMRRIAAWNDLPADTHWLLDRFVDRRLLVKDHRNGQTVVEVALESLLRQWDDLSQWLREQAEYLKTADTLERAAWAWEQHGRDNAWLLTGTRLLAAETLVTRPGYRERLAPAIGFVSAARRLHDDRANAELRATRTRARILTALVAVLVVAATLAGIGFVTANRASDRANAQTRQAIALRLIQDGEATLQGRQAGGDVHAMQEILAAHALAPGAHSDTALVDALNARRHLLHVTQTHSRILSVAYSLDGRRIVSGGDDGAIRIADAATGQPIGQPITTHTGWVDSVAFSPDSTRIVSGGNDHTLRLWDVVSRRQIGAPLTGHTAGVNAVAFSPDGHDIVSAGSDMTLRLWDASTDQQIGATLTGHTGEVNDVAFSPDGRQIVSSSSDQTLRLWDPSTGQQIGPPLTGHTGPVFGVAFSPDGSRIVSSGGDQTLRLWDPSTGQQIGAPFTVIQREPAGAPDPALAATVSFDRTGTRIVAGYSDYGIRMWNIATGTLISLPLVGGTDLVSSLAYNPDGTRIVSGSFDGTVRIWDTTTFALTGHTGAVDTVAFSPDGRQIVSGSSDRTLRLWDPSTGQQIGAPLTGHTGTVNSVAYSPDGTRIVSGSVDQTLRLWDPTTGRQIGPPLMGHTDQVWSVAFSPDGRRIVSAGNDQTLRLWDAVTGQQIGAPLTGHTDGVTSVAFSPDGRRIVSGGTDQTLRMWDAATGHLIGAPMTGNSGFIWSVAFSPDGTRIVSGGTKDTLQIWDATGRFQIGAPLTGHADWVEGVRFSPDGRHIASGSRDGTITLWPLLTPSVTDLCAKLPSNMSRKDWHDTVATDINYHTLCPALPISPDNND